MSVLSEEDLSGNYLEDGGLLDCNVGGGDGGPRLIDPSGWTGQLSPSDLIRTKVEDESIQINVNRENLKRRLLCRRTLPELVDQGILPPLNVPPAFADRQRHLQRAQTGDRLRQKLKERPDRECLVQHHILEDTSVLVDRSLQDKQRLLKKSRLQSDLSGRLASRPGPLELITKNILETDPQLKDGLIEGKISFKKTTEVDDPSRRLYHLDHYEAEKDGFGLRLDSIQPSNSIDFSALVSASDDSLTDSICLTPTECSERTMVTANSIPSPPGTFSVMSPKSSTAPSIPPAPDITPLLRNRKFHLVGPSLPPAPVFSLASGVQPAMLQSSSSSSGDLAVSLDLSIGTVGTSSKKTAKKSKNKGITKSKMIKFHEYKGPPNAVKSNSKLHSELLRDPPTSASNSYDVLLEQQQLFLQWQLEYQQKALLSRQQSETTQSAAVSVATTAAAQTSLSNSTPSESIQPATVGTSGMFSFKPLLSSAVSTATKPPSRLEDMKVTDLKSECRRLNLPSHGSKPTLIDRLTPHLSKINFSAGQTRDPVVSFRNSDSSSSGSSDGTTALTASVDSSCVQNQFGIQSDQKSVVPTSMEVSLACSSSILPMDVDQNSNQSAGGFICSAPATFIWVQAGPQVSQTPQKLSQVPYGETSQKDLVAPQILRITRPASVPSNNFSSLQVGNAFGAQPLMLLTQSLGAPRVIKSENLRTPLAAYPATQLARSFQRASRPRSESISSEELVIRQQHVISSLEQSLQRYQKQLHFTQQTALLQQMQLSSLVLDNATSGGHAGAGKSNVGASAFNDKGPVAAVTPFYDNGSCYRPLFTKNRLQIPYDFSTNRNSTVSSCKPVIHSPADPLLSVAPSSSLHLTSSGTERYPFLPDVSESSLKSILSSHCNALDDISDILNKKEELTSPICDNDVIASYLRDSSMLDNNNKQTLFLPDLNGSDFISGHHVNSSTFPDVNNAFPFDSKTSAISSKSSNSLLPQYSARNDVRKMDLCLAKPETTCINGNLDIADSILFSSGNMEWSEFDLDITNSQMDVGQYSLDNDCKAYKSFDLDISDIDWLSRNGDVIPPAAAKSHPSQCVSSVSSVTPYTSNEYLSSLRPGDELDFFGYDEFDPFASSDLSSLMNFETFADAQTSKINQL